MTNPNQFSQEFRNLAAQGRLKVIFNKDKGHYNVYFKGVGEKLDEKRSRKLFGRHKIRARAIAIFADHFETARAMNALIID